MPGWHADVDDCEVGERRIDGGDQARCVDGLRHDLVIEFKLTSRNSNIQGIKLNTLSLKFDESAPDFE